MRSSGEYPARTIKGAITKTKFNNALKRDHPDITSKLQNVRVNRETRGCTGFIHKTSDESRYVYVNTEYEPNLGVMYRLAENEKDFTGKRNRWCEPSEIVDKAVELLEGDKTD